MRGAENWGAQFAASLSVAGFKALPAENPPILHFPGLTILSGSNSGGKTSLMLALRVLRASMGTGGRPRVLLLVAPELPTARLGGLRAVHHEGRLEIPIRFRFATEIDEEPVMLELAFGPDLPIVEPEDEWDPANRASQKIWTIPLQSANSHRFDGTASRAAWGDVWDRRWIRVDPSGDGIRLETKLLSALIRFLNHTAVLDSLRGRPLTRWRVPDRGGLFYASDILPDGSNVEELLRVSDWDSDANWGAIDEQPCPPWIPGHRPWSGSKLPTLAELMSVLLIISGLEPMVAEKGDAGLAHVDAWAPGSKRTDDPFEWRRRRTSIRGLSDLGDGQQQVLPAMVQMILSQPGWTLLWEHPDLHLHPSAATQLGMLAYRLAAAGRSLVIETHSRDLIDGVRRAAASGGELERDGLKPGAARLVFFERGKTGLTHSNYDLRDLGRRLPWPEGFVHWQVVEEDEFEHSMRESLRVADSASIQALIRGGESDVVEFKASLHRKRVEDKSGVTFRRKDKEVQAHCLRAVAAFMNTKGGYLLIGVDDQGKVIGIDDDCKTTDEFARMIDDLVRTRLSQGGWQRYQTRFVEIEGRTVALIECRASPELVWLRWGDDRDELFVRRGNSTRPVGGPELEQLLRERSRRSNPDPT